MKRSSRKLIVLSLLASITLVTLTWAQTWWVDQLAQMLVERAKVRWERVPPKVLAFYYGWYGNPQVSGRWVHWERVDEANKRIGNSTHYPLLGPYDSHDPKVVEQHCRWAKDNGIDGFIASWWGPNDFTDQGMPLLLDTARKFGLEITAYFERVPTRTREQALQHVLYLLNSYGGHPAWLKLDGKPVLFIYTRAIGEIGLNDWLWVISEANRQYPGSAVFIGDSITKRAARIFDGIHTYNPTGMTARKSPDEIRQWAKDTFERWIATAGKGRIACVTIIAGYDDSRLGRPEPRPITDRHDGQTYRLLWEEAIAANPNWVLITSWNEWHEGSEIEPSVEHGDRELGTTADFSLKFKESASLPERLQTLPIGVLPNSDSEGLWFLLTQGVTPTVFKWEQIIDPQQFDPQKFPISLYAGGEAYRPTARNDNDVLQALLRYIRDGGVLLVLPSGPMPFHYDERQRVIQHWQELYMPLRIAWEQPPSDRKLTFIVRAPDELPHVPQQFPFPASGDRRWRPLLPEQASEGVQVRSLVDLWDDQGQSHGSAVALLKVGNGCVVYAWFRLLEMPEGEALLHDIWQISVRMAKAVSQQKLKQR